MADAPNPKYNPQSGYAQYQDCEGEEKDCVCCPIGTVAVTNDCGEIIGCLTPNDAEHYNASRIQCAEGYVKLLHPLTGEYMGCVTPEDAQSILAQLDPDVDPVPPVTADFNLLNQATALTGAVGVNSQEDITVEVDRIDCTDPLVIQPGTVNVFPAGVSMVGGPQVMLGTESTKDIQIDLADTLGAGVYNFDIEVYGCGQTKIIPVVLTIS